MNKKYYILIAAIAIFSGILFLIYEIFINYDKYIKITIEDCGRYKYFIKILEEEKIDYTILSNGDLLIDKPEALEKLDVLTNGDFSKFIPASVNTGSRCQEPSNHSNQSVE